MIYKPSDSIKVTEKVSGAYVFVFTNSSGEPCAHGYTAKAKKHASFRYRFLSRADREKRIARFFGAQRSWAEEKLERRAKANRPHNMEVGHILEYSWGYEQTNIDFFQVVRTTPKGVYIRPIASKHVDSTGYLQGKVVPDVDAFTGPEQFKRVSNNSVSMPHGWCGLWDGKPSFYSSYH